LFWKANKIYKKHWNKEEFINWTKSMIQIGQIQKAETYQGSSAPPESLDLHFVPFAQGMLYVGNVSPLTEEKLEVVKTLAEAFSIAYARYEDFKNIEEAKSKIEITLNELKLAQAKLQELDQLKSQFFANISHEFRTPLTLILGQAESLMSSNIDAKGKGKLQIINRNARKLLELINQLLDLSKLEAGSMELRSEQSNLVSFLKSLFYSFESLSDFKKITLKFNSESENIPVVFDTDKLEKVFYNLMSNSLKFTNENGEIIVTVKLLNDSKVEIRFRDTGKGISKENISHIFDRFYQVEGSNIREFEGTGIGLSLAKQLIELHKGNIKVESEVNSWTEFTIELPLGNIDKQLNENPKQHLTDINAEVLTDTEINEENPEEENNQTKNSEIVLIVEDNPDVRSYIREQIENEYTILEASNGEEGIAKAQSEIPDLIITDVMMPKMDGYQFSLNIKKNEKTSHIPIIMLTAKAALDDKIEGLETGVDAYITKPFSAKELVVRVRNLINQRKQLREKFKQATVIKPSEVTNVSVDQKFLENVINTIELNIGNENFALETLAAKVNMSVSQLNRKLNALIEQPPGHLIRSLRLQRAADLLKQNAGNVAEICYNVGFGDQANFSKAFKKQFGSSPLKYKKQFESNNHSTLS
jgi:signal transduction histidine kinase/DNA-binding response OmpR family regulator